MVKKPWRFHPGGRIECLLHNPGIVVHAGTCPHCDDDPSKKVSRYPGCPVEYADPYSTTSPVERVVQADTQKVFLRVLRDLTASRAQWAHDLMGQDSPILQQVGATFNRDAAALSWALRVVDPYGE